MVPTDADKLRSRSMRASMAIALLVAALLLRSAPALPDERPAPARGGGGERRSDFLDTLFWAPEIVVEATRIRPDDALFNRTGFVQLIELGPRRGRVEDAAALLARAVGVRVRRWGGLGSPAAVSIRGSSSTQVQFYLDGVPLNDAWSGTADLSDVPVSDIDRIEVFRGTSPTGFGGSSIGGTINLVSAPPRAGAGGRAAPLEARAAAGSFDAARLQGALRAAAGPLALRLGGGYERSAGDFPFLDDNGTPANPGDDSEALRINNDYSRIHLSGRLALDAPRFDDLSLTISDARREGGVPGIGSNQSAAARSERERRIGSLRVRPSPLAGRLVHLEGTGFYSWTADRFDDPGGEVGLMGRSTDNRIIAHGGSMRSKLFAPPIALTAELFLEGKKERFLPFDYLPAPAEGPDRIRRTFTVAGSADLGLLGGLLYLASGLRSEWSRSEYWDEQPFPWLPPVPQGPVERRETTPSAGFRLNPAGWITLKGNWGEHYRLPTFFELFGDLGTVTGVPDLGPERGVNRDIGIICSAERLWRIERPSLEAVWIANDVDDLILFFQNSQYTVRPVNIGAARIEGLELSAAGTLGGALRLTGHWSRIEARDTGPIPYYTGNLLPGRPLPEGGGSV
ncbi:MAG: TonB-dependent receptor, partial [Candidatus Krumholzibacteria bacterium]|nr:TonB-dependent receptor [Candidatus Krumholzibacteria bacterium]